MRSVTQHCQHQFCQAATFALARLYGQRPVQAGRDIPWAL